ncbi:MAG: preprotein translocase subunit YajC [Alphaproteobacteria bacterium]|nr:preprotein translocase subunit YajC [Alphaproteobacteria bacterium]MCD8520077.1 preprotein translocase subunit YajC [Alphaproteobacteria bacterium]MCD8526545.1 preprotein translocase subunit YajC [Alphaproteobacteria bacterium]MCD8571342.1 preprotein translocase subunit YajC [Alphaproteobacteria bacterium]
MTFFINEAFAQETSMTTGTVQPGDAAPMPPPVSPWEVMGTNVLMVVILVAMFYVLLIMPQQRRMKEHNTMLKGLKRGDSVVTAGGLVGVIDKTSDASDEVVVDLGNGIKVTALRSTIQAKSDPRLKPLPVAKNEDKKPAAAKKAPAKKTASKK